MEDIKIFKKPENISYEEITDLLHSAYAIWNEQNIQFTALAQSSETTVERIGNGTCLVALLNDTLVGTATYKKGFFKRNKPSLYVYMLAVDPQFQSLGIASKLLDYIENVASVKENVPYITLETAVPAKRLVKWYKRRHYKKYGFASAKETSYYSYLFVKPVNGQTINALSVFIGYIARIIKNGILYKKNGQKRF